jgi:hypothetical protein
MPGGSGTASRKPAGKRKKGKDTAADEEEEDLLIEKVPTENTAVSIKTWGRLRESNPYQFEERTYSRGDKMFWTKTQYCFWEDFYNNPEYTKTGSFVQPKAINQEELNLYAPTEFRFVIETLKKLGLYDLVCLKPGDGTGVYCPDLIRQFHCTAYFHEDPARTITWMSGTEQHSCNYIDFCQAMGFGAGRARGFKIHSEKSFTHGAISFCYPPVPQHPPPMVSGMYYSYQLLSKIFRESLVSKSGDASDVRSYHLNLMFFCRLENARQIDGCDYLYNELKRSIHRRMTPNFTQYVQQLIDTIVPAPGNRVGQQMKMDPFKIPFRGELPEVPEMEPQEPRTKARHDPAASSSSSLRPQRGVARFFSNLWAMCKNTNDVAHQSLAMNQETRRRQNAFFAERNHPVPPIGPELDPVVAPAWEMPPLGDAMFQNFDPLLYAPRAGASSSRTRFRTADATDDDDGSGSGSGSGSASGSDDDDGEEAPEDLDFI